MNLGVPRGSAPGLRRPVVVVQSNHYNASRLQTVIVVVLTTNRRLAAMPGNVLVPADASGLVEDSVANVTQVATVDREDLDERVGEVPGWILDEIESGLRRVLSL